MVLIYAKELQENTDKYVMKYISEIIKLAFEKNLIALEDLYQNKESEVISILERNFDSWNDFKKATELIRTDAEPTHFYASFKPKKRNVIPLVSLDNQIERVINITSSII